MQKTMTVISAAATCRQSNFINEINFSLSYFGAG